MTRYCLDCLEEGVYTELKRKRYYKKDGKWTNEGWAAWQKRTWCPKHQHKNLSKIQRARRDRRGIKPKTDVITAFKEQMSPMDHWLTNNAFLDSVGNQVK